MIVEVNNTLHKWALITAISVSVISYNLWPYANAHGWAGFFYQGMAFFYSIIFWLLTDLYKNDSVLKKISTIGLWFMLNNLVDEFVGDPQKYGLNEYIFAGIIIYITLKKNATKSGKTEYS